MVAGHVKKDGDPAVRLVARLGQEFDPALPHAVVRGLEILDAQEQPDATRELAADRLLLILPVRLREQQRGLGVERSDNNPAFRAPVVRQGRRILEKLESELPDEEVDADVVVIHDDGHLLKMH